LEELLESCSN